MRFVTSVLVLVTLGFASRTSPAHAEDASTVVLGLRSAEGDDELAIAFTDALRTAARRVSGWKVVDRAVSMAQMSVAHGCEDIDAACLSEIAKGLQADRLLFGTVRRTAGGNGKYDYEASVSLFNATTRSIGGTDTTVIPRAEAKQKKSLGTRAEPLVARLSQTDSGSGVLSVQVNVASAEVRLDGQVVGQTRDKSLLLEGLKEGEHRLEITAIGHLAHNQQILIAAGQRTEIKVSLEPLPEASPEPPAPIALGPEEEGDTGGSSISWLGYTLIGVGVASFAGWGVSMYMVGSTNDDDSFTAYKNAFPQTVDDVCEFADDNNTAGGRVTATQVSEVKSLCSRGRTFNMLQWVFLGTGVLAAGIGTFILVSDGGGAEEQEPALTLSPQFDTRSFSLQTKLRF